MNNNEEDLNQVEEGQTAPPRSKASKRERKAAAARAAQLALAKRSPQGQGEADEADRPGDALEQNLAADDAPSMTDPGALEDQVVTAAADVTEEPTEASTEAPAENPVEDHVEPLMETAAEDAPEHVVEAAVEPASEDRQVDDDARPLELQAVSDTTENLVEDDTTEMTPSADQPDDATATQEDKVKALLDSGGLNSFQDGEGTLLFIDEDGALTGTVPLDQIDEAYAALGRPVENESPPTESLDDVVRRVLGTDPSTLAPPAATKNKMTSTRSAKEAKSPRVSKMMQDQVPSSNARPPREGSERFLVFQLMDGTLTAKEIASIMRKKNVKFDAEGKYVYAWAWCNHRDHGIGYRTIDGKLIADVKVPEVVKDLDDQTA